MKSNGMDRYAEWLALQKRLIRDAMENNLGGMVMEFYNVSGCDIRKSAVEELRKQMRGKHFLSSAYRYDFGANSLKITVGEESAEYSYFELYDAICLWLLRRAYKREEEE